MDVIEAQLPWLDGDVRDAGNESLAYTDPSGREIAAVLRRGWGEGDRLALIRVLVKAWGAPPVFSTLDDIVRAHARRYWKSVANGLGDHSFPAFEKALWGTLPASFEYERRESAGEVTFRVSRCPHAEAALAVDAGEIFYHLVCAGDPAAIEGFCPGVGFARTSTLAQGMGFCDHRYTLPRTASKE